MQRIGCARPPAAARWTGRTTGGVSGSACSSPVVPRSMP
ncbi:hypothetical protein ATSB10_25910 [Dyella thiooxydans]|uniref:Uncharacterized protein n=1 Tax=Dyella thiooxydans TaxID=445710 RepID=A0A161J2W3_9GAMM|nr:hypothetical protein ATSB10_25910 [Dyella thiooxydans]